MAKKKKGADPAPDQDVAKCEEPKQDSAPDQDAESSSYVSDIQNHPKFAKFKKGDNQ